MGRQVIFIKPIPRYGLEETEKTIEKMEIIFDELKDFLIEIRKDLISYSNNET
jgi:hypothetical protein